MKDDREIIRINRMILFWYLLFSKLSSFIFSKILILFSKETRVDFSSSKIDFEVFIESLSILILFIISSETVLKSLCLSKKMSTSLSRAYNALVLFEISNRELYFDVNSVSNNLFSSSTDDNLDSKSWVMKEYSLSTEFDIPL
ncbi:unnamed protein product [[Candida] boidinii]|nr:unnamed protein product [[Candida] boidinii]